MIAENPAPEQPDAGQELQMQAARGDLNHEASAETTGRKAFTDQQEGGSVSAKGKSDEKVGDQGEQPGEDGGQDQMDEARVPATAADGAQAVRGGDMEEAQVDQDAEMEGQMDQAEMD